MISVDQEGAARDPIRDQKVGTGAVTRNYRFAETSYCNQPLPGAFNTTATALLPLLPTATLLRWPYTQGLFNMARTNARTALAATAIATGTIGTAPALANLPATPAPATGPVARPVPANAHKYGTNHRVVATKAVAYTLTAHGAATATAGAGKSGKPTVMALVAVAAAAATQRNAGGGVTGQQIVAAMRTLPAVVAAYGNTKAGKYAGGGALPCPAWCNGYIAGAARQGLLVAATPATVAATA